VLQLVHHLQTACVQTLNRQVDFLAVAACDQAGTTKAIDATAPASSLAHLFLFIVFNRIAPSSNFLFQFLTFSSFLVQEKDEHFEHSLEQKNGTLKRMPFFSSLPVI
jgi:hypothetical protein